MTEQLTEQPEERRCKNAKCGKVLARTGKGRDYCGLVCSRGALRWPTRIEPDVILPNWRRRGRPEDALDVDRDL